MSRSPAALRLAPEWDGRTGRMVALSAAAHLLALSAVVLVGPFITHAPEPIVAYTVELTDGAGLGGRLPPGAPGKNLNGGQAAKPPPPSEPPAAPAPEPPKAAVEEPVAPDPPAVEAQPKPAPPPEPVKEPVPAKEPVAVKPPEPDVRLPEKPEPVKVEPPKPPVEKAQPVKTAPAPEPPKPAPKPVQQAAPKPPPVAAPPRPVPKPSPATVPAGAPTQPATSGSRATEPREAPGKDAYAEAAERFRGQPGGGGVGGHDVGSGPVGSGGDGGGGGRLVGLEFLAYQQQVINAVKGNWINVAATPGLVAKVRFEISSDGAVSGVRMEQGSGNAAYDASVQRAVLRSNPLPAPPGRYVNEFREFVIEFHSEDKGGMGAG